MKRLSILALLLFALCSGAFAQETLPPVRMGVIGGGTVNIHRGDFATYDGILECALFEDATTIGWLGGYALDIPIAPSLGLATRLYYWKGDGDFTSPNPVNVRVAVDDTTVVPLTSEHHLDATLDYVVLDLLGRWNLFGPLYVAAGAHGGLATRASYEQEEVILSPFGMVFDNGQPTRKIIAGNFDREGTRETRRALRLGATAAIGVDLRLGGGFVLSPEVGWSSSFTDVLTSFPWSIDMLRAGATLGLELGATAASAPLPPPPAARPTLAMGVGMELANGSRLPYADVTLVEEQGTELLPLLPYVFFDAGSAELPSRYDRLTPAATGSFREEDLRDSVLGLYHQLLNIVGERMRETPSASITLTGCVEPLDDTAGVERLAMRRAERVRDYLVESWGISPGRIDVVARQLPSEVSNRTVADGREENRRVEIAASDPRIIAPITRRERGRTLEPARLIVTPRVTEPEQIAGWRLRLEGADGSLLWSDQGTGAPHESTWESEVEKIATQLRGAESVRLMLRLEAETKDGGLLREEREVPAHLIRRSRRITGEEVRDSLIERYSLIFFDFDKPRVSDFNRSVVGLVQRRMKTSSAVQVSGFTDRIGEAEYNATLSTRRAEAIASEIRERIVPEVLRTSGEGERLIYDNDLPEGRMYNRTVVIEIATPLEEVAR